MEVEVRRVDPERRSEAFERLVQRAGPPDASVILTVRYTVILTPLLY